MNSVTVIAFPTAPIDKADALWQQLTLLVQATRKEPGCVSFTAHRHPTVPHRFAVYEQFFDRAAFDAHLQYAHTQRFIQWVETNDVSLQFEQWDEIVTA